MRSRADRRTPLEAPSSAPTTHSATGPSRAPRALHSVACGGRRSSIQSVPAERTWTTARPAEPRQRLHHGRVARGRHEEVDGLEVGVRAERDDLDAGGRPGGDGLEGVGGDGRAAHVPRERPLVGDGIGRALGGDEDDPAVRAEAELVAQRLAARVGEQGPQGGQWARAGLADRQARGGELAHGGGDRRVVDGDRAADPRPQLRPGGDRDLGAVQAGHRGAGRGHDGRLARGERRGQAGGGDGLDADHGHAVRGPEARRGGRRASRRRSGRAGRRARSARRARRRAWRSRRSPRRRAGSRRRRRSAPCPAVSPSASARATASS